MKKIAPPGRKGSIKKSTTQLPEEEQVPPPAQVVDSAPPVKSLNKNIENSGEASKQNVLKSESVAPTVSEEKKSSAVVLPENQEVIEPKLPTQQREIVEPKMHENEQEIPKPSSVIVEEQITNHHYQEINNIDASVNDEELDDPDFSIDLGKSSNVLAKFNSTKSVNIDEVKPTQLPSSKRRSFLSEMEDFSNDFVNKIQLKEEQIASSNVKHDELLTQINQPTQRVVDPPKPLPNQTSVSSLPPPPVVSVPIVETKEEPPREEVNVEEVFVESSKQAKSSTKHVELFEASSLADTPVTSEVAIEELKVPQRIGGGVERKNKVEPKKNEPVFSNASSSSNVKETVPKAANEDNEEEGTGDINSLSNFLTAEERARLTPGQKANWRAKQADLYARRKDFHGAVTYMFDGIFSWQMYGSAEAIDEYGNSYTEYLMRCQWGTTFENLQPWIVAHRYREFDKLDQDLKKKFPGMEKNMPKLPQKELFRSMDSSIVAQRRTTIEDYMAKVVVSMPTLLRSDVMDQFLRISERIIAIRGILKLNETKLTRQELLPHDPLATEEGSRERTQTAVNRKEQQEEDSGTQKSLDWSSMIWTAEEAESVRETSGATPFDEDGLGSFEEDLRALIVFMNSKSTQEILSRNGEFRNMLVQVSIRWPSLKATGSLNLGNDFALIPRALQAEEDLTALINEFRSLETVRAIRK